MAAFLKDIEQFRSITWATEYMWDVKIDGCPSPFNGWIPATDIDRDLVIGTAVDIPGPMSTYKIPTSTGAQQISMTLLDTDQRVLLNWLSSWFNIYDENEGVLTLSESTKEITIATLNVRRDVIATTKLLVFPEGTISFRGSSNPGFINIPIKLNIAGR